MQVIYNLQSVRVTFRGSESLRPRQDMLSCEIMKKKLRIEKNRFDELLGAMLKSKPAPMAAIVKPKRLSQKPSKS